MLYSINLMIEKLLVTNGIIVIFAAEFRYQKISVCFSPGDFKEVAPRLRKKKVNSDSSSGSRRRRR